MEIWEAEKTHLTRGISSAFDIDQDSVTSPTFTLVNEYRGPSITLYHFDAYRIKEINEFFEMGYEDYFFSDSICIIEWPEKVEPLLPDHTIRLYLEHTGPASRKIFFVATT